MSCLRMRLLHVFDDCLTVVAVASLPSSDAAGENVYVPRPGTSAFRSKGPRFDARLWTGNSSLTSPPPGTYNPSFDLEIESARIKDKSLVSLRNGCSNYSSALLLFHQPPRLHSSFSSRCVLAVHLP